MAFKVIGLILMFGFVAATIKVPVTIYYESLCEDSAKFITQQVYPTLQTELKDYAHITWVPFGKSKFSTLGSDVLFNCHHGINECYGNKVHACAIEYIQANSYETEFTRETLTLDFINCMMQAGKNFPDNVYPGERCARNNHINIWENIQQCANSTEGSQLLKRHGETTNRFQNPLTSVPTVVFKEQYDSKENERAMSYFKATLCNYIPERKPQICNDSNGVSAAHAAPLLLGILFVGLKLIQIHMI